MNKKATALFEHVKKGSRINYCPFLYSWFLPKLEEILQLPEKPSREGINPEDPKPMPRHKKLLMLVQIIYPKLSLKTYAETYNLSYGTVRNWNVETQFIKRQRQLSEEYINLFMRRLKELIEESEDFNEVIQYLNEVKYYQNFMFITRIRDELIKIVKDISHLGTQSNALRYSAAYEHFIISILSEGLFKDHDALRNVFEQHFDGEKNMVEKVFSWLIKELKNGDVKQAIVAAELLKSCVVPNMKNLKYFALAHHDLKYGKKKRRPK